MEGLTFKHRYQVKELIGEGGMSKVYLCDDIFLKREVALKVLKKETLQDVSAMERFKKEITASTNLLHKNIVQVYDVDFANDH